MLVACEDNAPTNKPPEARQPIAPVTMLPDEPMQTIRLQEYFSDPDESDTLTYTAQSGDPTVAIVTVRGAVLTITAIGPGTVTITVTATDPDQASIAQSFDVTVPDTQPSFGAQTAVDQTYTVGTAITPLVLPEATGGNGRLTYSLTPTVPGLQFEAAARTLRGTPSAAGTYAMTYRVVDSDGADATLRFTIEVGPTPVADTQPSFGAQTAADQTYTVGTAITPLVLPKATGGNGRLTYSLTPTVPSLRFDAATRTLRGTPSSAGTYRMTYRVVDSDGDDATLRFTIEVGPTPVADTQPSFGAQTAADQTYTVGTAITPLVLPEATGGNGRLTYSLTPTVSGLRFDAASRTLRGTPSSAGTYPMTYRVVDNDGDDAALQFTIVVDLPDTQPSFGGQTVPDQTYTVGAPITPLVLPEATGGDGRLTYSLTPTVPGLHLRFDAARTLDGTPTAVGVYGMEYRVEDTDGDAATLDFRITVNTGSGPKIYWTERASDEIWRANLDGSGIEKIIDDVRDPADIDLDLDAGKMYWIGEGNKFGWDGYIWRANLDGSEIEVVYRFRRDGPIFPVALAVDARNRKLYWTNDALRNDAGEDRIMRANLDGGASVEILVVAEEASCRAPRICFRGPDGIALDVTGGKMYWLDNLSEKIWRADLDGGNAETLADFGISVYLNSIEIDAVGGKMYFSSGGDEIYRSNLDGSGVERILRFGFFASGYIRGMALDVSSRKIYFANGDKIQRANLDGSQLEDVVTETGAFFNPSWVALDLRDR